VAEFVNAILYNLRQLRFCKATKGDWLEGKGTAANTRIGHINSLAIPVSREGVSVGGGGNGILCVENPVGKFSVAELTWTDTRVSRSTLIAHAPYDPGLARVCV